MATLSKITALESASLRSDLPELRGDCRHGADVVEIDVVDSEPHQIARGAEPVARTGQPADELG
jgi:hypothetical protein